MNIYRVYWIAPAIAMATGGCGGEPSSEGEKDLAQRTSSVAAPLLAPPATGELDAGQDSESALQGLLEAPPLPAPPDPAKAVPVEDALEWIDRLPQCGNKPPVVSLPQELRDRPAAATRTLAHLLLGGGDTPFGAGTLVTLASWIGEADDPSGAAYMEAFYDHAVALAHRGSAETDHSLVEPQLFERQIRNAAFLLRRGAIRAADRLTHPNAETLLGRALDDEDVGIRYEAAAALSRRPGSPHQDRVETMAAIEDADDETLYYVQMLRDRMH